MMMTNVIIVVEEAYEHQVHCEYQKPKRGLCCKLVDIEVLVRLEVDM